MGLFSLNPASWVTSIKDDQLERSIAQVVVSLGYSQYITFLYETGKALAGKKFIGFLSPVLTRMAASALTMLALQDTEKTIYLSVPRALVEDKVLLDSIHWQKGQAK